MVFHGLSRSWLPSRFALVHIAIVVQLAVPAAHAQSEQPSGTVENTPPSPDGAPAAATDDGADSSGQPTSGSAPETVPAPEQQQPDAAELDEIAKALAADAPPPSASSPPPSGSASGSVMNPNISLILDAALAYFSDDDHLQTGAHDPVEDGFNLQQLEMALNSAVDPYFRFDSNIVFSQFGVEVEEAYATTLSLPYNLQARAGQFLTRFGRANSTHPHTWLFADQPLVIGRYFGAEGNRGLGAELSYLTPLPFYLELVGSVTDAGGEATARSFFGASDLGVDDPLDLQYTASAKSFAELSPDWSLLGGLSFATGPNATGRTNRTELYGVDLFLKYRPITRQSTTIVELQSEWVYRRRQIPDDVLSDLSGYVHLFWRFSQRWGLAGRYELGTAAKNDAGEVGLDDLDPAWADSRHRGAANLTFWPTEFSRLRVQGSVDLPGWRDDPIFATFFAMEVVIGAHGAHHF